MNHDLGSEYTARIYRKEEEFLEDFYLAVEELLPRLDADWKPNFQCNDRERERRRLALVAGKLDQLVFDEAVVGHNRQGFSSLDVHLRSSNRLLIVRIRWNSSGMIVKKRLDCEPWP
jgi:hypothetical protein